LLIFFASLFVAGLLVLGYVDRNGVPGTSGEGAASRIRENAFRSLKIVADIEQERLDLWIEERRADTRAVAESDVVDHHVLEVLVEIATLEKSGAQGQDLWDSLSETLAYQQLAQHLAQVASGHDIYDDIEMY